MGKITKVKRNICALSPVITVLLMIAITVVASLVAYAWIAGYLNFTSNKIGQNIQVQSVTVDPLTNNLMVYVQNVGQGTVQLDLNSVYVNGKLESLLSIDGSSAYPFYLLKGDTATLIVDHLITSTETVLVKVVGVNGAFAEFSSNLSPAVASTDEKIVYVAVCIDTEFLSPNGHEDYMGTINPNPELDMSEYSTTDPLNVAAVYDDAFRSKYVDSYGSPVKITWFAEMDYFMSQGNYVWSDGSPAGVSGYTAIYDILMDNWSSQFHKYDDTFGYHHHFLVYDETWQNPSGDICSDNYDYQMDALDHMIIDNNFYPSTWRTGRNLMSPGLSDWLEQWIPYDYTSTVYTGTWYPVHPSGMDRWTISAENPPTQEGVNAAFEQANTSGTALYSFWCHDKNDMVSTIDAMHVYLNKATSNPSYQNITFRYVSAEEAMQKVLNLKDTTAPSLTLTSNGDEYTIKSNEPLWGNHPYIALKLVDNTYMHVTSTSVGTNTWTFTLPTNIISEDNVATRARGTDGLDIVSADASDYGTYHLPQDAIDGDDTAMSFWDSTPGSLSSSAQWLQLDLGSVKTFNTVKTHFFDADDRSYTYHIDVSTDGVHWTTQVSQKTGSSVMLDTFASAVDARYVRIVVTAATANPYAHIIEVNIGGTEPSISSSSSEDGHTADHAIDGIEFSYNFWQSLTQSSLSNSPQHLQVDIRDPTEISKITTHFDDEGNVYSYKIETSMDGSSWSTVVAQKTGSGTVTDTFSQTTARFIRITINGNSGGNFAQIQEFKIYHEESVSLPEISVIGLGASDLSGNTAVKITNIS